MGVSIADHRANALSVPSAPMVEHSAMGLGTTAPIMSLNMSEDDMAVGCSVVKAAGSHAAKAARSGRSSRLSGELSG